MNPAPDDTVVRGTYVAPEVKAQFDSLRAFFDATASMDRIDSYAKWIFASSAIVGALGAGLSNAAFAKASGGGVALLAASVLCLGVSLVAACRSIAPAVVKVLLDDLDDMRAAVNRQFTRRQRYVNVAAWFYALAIFLAALVPLLSLLGAKATPRLSYAIDARGDLVAGVAARGMKQGDAFELDVDRQGAHLASAGVVIDASGDGLIQVGPVALDPGETAVVVKQRSAGGGEWKELERVSVRR